MPIEFFQVVVAAFGALFLTGCASMGDAALKDNWGEANRQTMAAQIIDPVPEYADANPTTSGEHAAQAIERYRTDKVKKPDKVKTTTAGSAAAAGGSGGN